MNKLVQVPAKCECNLGSVLPEEVILKSQQRNLVF